MTTRLEDELTEAMREHAGGVSLRTDVVTAAAQRHRRRTMLHRGAYTLGILGLAGAVTAVIAISGTASTTAPEATRRGQATAEDTPTLRLAAAATATAETTFRVGVAYTVAPEGGPERTIAFAGAYDPVHDRGYLNFVGGPGPEIRVFGEDLYLLRGRWVRVPADRLARMIGIAGGRSGIPLDVMTAHPEKLLAQLRSLGDVTHAGQSGGIDTYRYTFKVPANGSVAAHSVTGEVQVNARTNLIVAVAQQATVTSTKPGVADPEPVTVRTKVTFSDFGIPVTVERPTT